MERYKLWLGKDATKQQALEAIRLFKKLGYKPRSGRWNRGLIDASEFDCVYADEEHISLHWHGEFFFIGDANSFYTEITIEELRKLTESK